MYAVLVAAPLPIAVDETLSITTGKEIGSLITVRPYFSRYTFSGEFTNWTPTTSDILAADWFEVK